VNDDGTTEMTRGWRWMACNFSPVLSGRSRGPVLLIILWYNRVRFSNLFSNVPEWIEELTLPGGTKIRFQRRCKRLLRPQNSLQQQRRKRQRQIASPKLSRKDQMKFLLHSTSTSLLLWKAF